MKKLLFFLWALMFLPALNASAEDMPEAIISGDFEYVLSEDGTAEIAGYTGEDRILVIPETLDGHAVTRIRDEAFQCCNMASVTIPDSITYIDDSAFSECKLLTSVTIPDGVAKISDYTFYHCDSLASVSIPDSVKYIGDSAF